MSQSKTMTVYELIQKLSKYPSDFIVSTENNRLKITNPRPVQEFDWDDWDK